MSFPGSLPQLASSQLDPPFTARIDLVDGRAELTGALDHRTAHLIGDATTALVRTSSPWWVLDVAGLTGCDHAGLRAIGAAYRKAVCHGRQLTVIGAPADAAGGARPAVAGPPRPGTRRLDRRRGSMRHRRPRARLAPPQCVPAAVLGRPGFPPVPEQVIQRRAAARPRGP